MASLADKRVYDEGQGEVDCADAELAASGSGEYAQLTSPFAGFLSKREG
jgi:hypothetical protein